MPNIIQIEELVYTRLPRISKSEWLKMLSKQGVSNDYALLLDDYLLIEQTDYRFSNGNYISSERTVYNIDYTTYDTAENTPNPDNTEEIITVRYDSTHDRYYVYYTHFPIEDIPHTPDLFVWLLQINPERMQHVGRSIHGSMVQYDGFELKYAGLCYPPSRYAKNGKDK